MSSKFSFNKKTFQKFGSVSLALLLVMTLVQFYRNSKRYEIQSSSQNIEEQKNTENEIPYTEQIQTSNKKIVVHIVGEVNNPSVVEMDEGGRLYEAIEKAGGFSDTADKEKINLAQELVDGSQYIIPKVGEELVINKGDGSVMTGYASENDGKVNINTATTDEFQQLDGIGEVLAKRIVEHREKNGKFKDITDLLEVDGIGDGKFNSIKDSIYCK